MSIEFKTCNSFFLIFLFFHLTVLYYNLSHNNLHNMLFFKLTIFMFVTILIIHLFIIYLIIHLLLICYSFIIHLIILVVFF